MLNSDLVVLYSVSLYCNKVICTDSVRRCSMWGEPLGGLAMRAVVGF